jgi:molecular chaperone GrpE (heat shock protein)
MSQDKEDYEVGIPLEDLPAQDASPDNDPAQSEEEPIVDDLPESEKVGLPSLFDEEELAEVGLKASSFKEENESLEPDAALLAEPESGEDQSRETPAENPIAVSEELATVEPVPADQETLMDEPPGEQLSETTADLTPSASEPDDLQQQLDAIQSQLVQLTDEFQGKLKYDAHKDDIIDRLHQELQEYKQDIVKKHILSIVLDVVKVADDIRKWIVYFRSLDVSQRDPVKLFRYLEAIPSDLEDIFYWQGVRPYSNTEGPFDPARQRTIKKIATDDISKDKTIAKSIRPGYEWEGKVIRQEMVAVYVYEDANSSTDDDMSVDTGYIDE